MERKYGWIKQPDDYKDLKIFSMGKPSGLIIPDEIDLEPKMPPIYDQGQTSSCTGNGVARVIQYGLKIAGLPDPVPSRLWLYGNGRKIEGAYSTDGGANIRDVIKGANIYGIIPETDWDFDVSKVTTPLPDPLYKQAADLRIHYYASPNLSMVDSLRLCLLHDHPIVFGFNVYDFFESDQMAKSGILHLPTSSESFLGGHCTVIAGADHPNRRFKIANSWGPSWANKGYYFMDYDYVVSTLCSDPWVNIFKKAA